MAASGKKIFYGWWNVATGFVGMGLSYAMFTVFAFGTFVRPLQEEFGWTRGELSFAYTMANIAVVIASPCLGILIDRFGVRRILIPSIILMGFTVASMALLTNNIWHYYALYFLIPLLGAGTLPQSYSRVLIAWFNRRRGIALGISLAGFGVGGALVPVISQFTIESFGWRIAYIGFACSVFVLALPMALFVLREKPEDLGLLADGDAPVSESAGKSTASLAETGLSGREAAKTISYWLILVSFLLVGLSLTGILAHLVPMLIDRGVSAQTAAFCMTSIGIGIIFGRIFAGYLMDYFFAPYVTAFFLSGMTLGIVILATGTTSSFVFLAAVLVGMGTGSEVSEIAYICSRYFGRKAFGLIYGIMFSAFQLGASFGAPLMGFYHDKAGDYIGALWFLAGMALLGAILISLLKPYPQLQT
ncbi:MAG: MFS family permease [Planctomycetota bacterium]|jgi:MFS family permease